MLYSDVSQNLCLGIVQKFIYINQEVLKDCSNRRKIIGLSTDMIINAITLLEKSGGRRDLTKGAI